GGALAQLVTPASGATIEPGRRATLVPARIARQHRYGLAVHLENARANRRHLAPRQPRYRLGDGRVGADQLEILEGRRAQRHLLPPERRQRLGGRQPAQIDDLVSVHLGRLPRGGGRREEARVEANRLLLGRDPVGEVRELIGGEREALGPEHVEEG